MTSNNLNSVLEKFDNNYLLILEYSDEIKNILVTNIVDNGNNVYSINLENQNYFGESKLKKIKLYFYQK